VIGSINFKWADLTDRVAEDSHEHKILFEKKEIGVEMVGTINARWLVLQSPIHCHGNYREEADLNRYQMKVSD
jgi:hypothetical protein